MDAASLMASCKASRREALPLPRQMTSKPCQLNHCEVLVTRTVMGSEPPCTTTFSARATASEWVRAWAQERMSLGINPDVPDVQPLLPLVLPT